MCLGFQLIFSPCHVLIMQLIHVLVMQLVLILCKILVACFILITRAILIWRTVTSAIFHTVTRMIAVLRESRLNCCKHACRTKHQAGSEEKPCRQARLLCFLSPVSIPETRSGILRREDFWLIVAPWRSEDETEIRAG